MWYGDSFVYDGYLFYVRINGSVSRGAARYGILGSADALVCDRNGGNQNCLDIYGVSAAPFIGCAVYFLSCVMVRYNCAAGNLLFPCAKKGEEEIFIQGLIKASLIKRKIPREYQGA